MSTVLFISRIQESILVLKTSTSSKLLRSLFQNITEYLRETPLHYNHFENEFLIQALPFLT
jgi:hypothetical protein